MTVGEVLRRTREEKNLTVKNVVDETYIQPRFIIALECNDYAAFPADAYIKGFLKIYSELLDLDPDQMQELYKNTKDTVEPHYDEDYYKDAMAMEPEINSMEHLEQRDERGESSESLEEEQPHRKRKRRTGASRLILEQLTLDVEPHVYTPSKPIDSAAVNKQVHNSTEPELVVEESPNEMALEDLEKLVMDDEWLVTPDLSSRTSLREKFQQDRVENRRRLLISSGIVLGVLILVVGLFLLLK